jgi:hypothetical protein
MLGLNKYKMHVIRLRISLILRMQQRYVNISKHKHKIVK